jgi:hypothetical protein
MSKNLSDECKPDHEIKAGILWFNLFGIAPKSVTALLKHLYLLSFTLATSLCLRILIQKNIEFSVRNFSILPVKHRLRGVRESMGYCRLVFVSLLTN